MAPKRQLGTTSSSSTPATNDGVRKKSRAVDTAPHLLSVLPTDLLDHVLSCLWPANLQTLGRACMTCKSMRERRPSVSRLVLDRLGMRGDESPGLQIGAPSDVDGAEPRLAVLAEQYQQSILLMLSINQPGVDQLVRCHSLNSLKVLDPMVIAQHAPALLALLQDPSHNVRTNVVHALRPLGARWQGEHAIKQLVLRLESDENVWARFAVLKTLSRFEPHALAPYAKEVAFSLLATGDSRPPIPAQGAFSLQLQLELQGENAARGNMRMVRNEAFALLRRVRDHNRRSSRLAMRDVARALLPAMREHECAEIAGEVADVVERELCAVED